MSTWTRAQIDQVAGVRSTVVVDPLVVQRAASAVMQEVRSEIADRIVDMCHPFGVEVDPRDLEWVETVEDFGVKVTGRWRPSTLTVELAGGPEDGAMYEVQGAPRDPVMVAVIPAIDWSAPPDEPVPTPDHLRYELSGWNESRRCWIYSVRLPNLNRG